MTSAAAGVVGGRGPLTVLPDVFASVAVLASVAVVALLHQSDK
ncbi:hypothetical protein [Halorubellus salinus]|nr:hypothetical protein [Halorubellus salinus]